MSLNMSKSDKSKTRSAPIVKKEVRNTAKVGEAISITLVKENRMKDYIRIFLGSLSGTRREAILHPPIGQTGLGEDEWVMSDPSDIPLLLSRVDDPKKEALRDLRTNWILEKAVVAGHLKKEADGTYVYAVGEPTTRSVFFAQLRSEWAAKQPKDQKGKFDLNSALAACVDQRNTAERAVRKMLADYAKEAEGKFPSRYLTCGGSRGDRPQVSVQWAKGPPAQSVCDMLVLHGINGPPAGPLTGNSDGDTVAGTDVPGTVCTSGTGNSTQWCFLPADLPTDIRKGTRASLAKVKKELEAATGKKYNFTVSEA
jgi:hypothetical protein